MRSTGVHLARGGTRRGISLLECLMLMTILAIISSGVGKVLQVIAKVPGQTNTTLSDETNIVSKMEYMRSVSYDSISIGTGISPYSSEGVYVDAAYADPTGGNSPSSNWKKITVRNSSGRQVVLMVCKP